MRIGVLSDTHIPDRTATLPVEILDLFSSVDLILHAGDVCQPPVLHRLGQVAPVVAVRGNRDDEALPGLPEQTIVSAGSVCIGLIHGQRSRSAELADRLRYLTGDHLFVDQRRYLRLAFAGDDVRCIVFGHTHQACCAWQDGVLFFNPGGVVRSPGGGPSSIGILEVDGDAISGQIVCLSHPPHVYALAERMQRRSQRV